MSDSNKNKTCAYPRSDNVSILILSHDCDRFLYEISVKRMGDLNHVFHKRSEAAYEDGDKAFDAAVKYCDESDEVKNALIELSDGK